MHFTNANGKTCMKQNNVSTMKNNTLHSTSDL